MDAAASGPPCSSQRRAALLLAVLTLGGLPAWWLAASGLLGRDIGFLLWAALVVPPAVTAALLLDLAYLAARGQGARGWTNPRLLLPIFGTCYLFMTIILAVPPLLHARLPPQALRLIEADAGRANTLRQRAVEHPEPARRRQAAWELYILSGERAMFMNRQRRPMTFAPTGSDRVRRAFFGWLKDQPGARPAERRWLALSDITLIIVVLAGLPLVHHLARRSELESRLARP